MNRTLRFAWLAVFAGLVSCSAPRNTTVAGDDGKLEMVFVQVNDVYEIAPLGGGKEGGMARVATIKKQYQQTNPNTMLIMAGDFLSPSVYNSLLYAGKPIRGKQMVDAMNAAGLDLAVFGNHEFDISETELQDCINASNFQWVSSNSFHQVRNQLLPFEKRGTQNADAIPLYYIRTVQDADGTTARIGFMGITLPFNKANYVGYTDPLMAAKQVYNTLKDSVDAVVAVTHQTIEEDMRLARELPGLSAILGGHEHDMRMEKVGNVTITKAHANAKSAFVVKLEINKRKHTNTAVAELKYLNESYGLDRSTGDVVQRWVNVADSSYAAIGFNAKEVVLKSGVALDGREAQVRRTSTNLTGLITASIADACPKADVVLLNAGSIRLDDILTPPVSQYDIIRALPFGGGIREVDMKGILLQRILEAGRLNTGTGGYLQAQPLSFDATNRVWKVGNQLLDVYKTYRVAITDFLFSGKEANLGFVNKDNPDIIKVYDAEINVGNAKSDVRLAVISFLKKVNR